MASKTLPKRKNRRWLFGGIGLIVLAIIIAIFINNRLNNAERAEQGPDTVPVERGRIVASVAGNGIVAAPQTLDLSFQSTGIVTEVFVEEGNAVKKDDVLARLDDRALKLDLENADVSNIGLNLSKENFFKIYLDKFCQM